MFDGSAVHSWYVRSARGLCSFASVHCFISTVAGRSGDFQWPICHIRVETVLKPDMNARMCSADVPQEVSACEWALTGL